MKYNANNKPLVCMMTQSTCYKGTKEMEVKGILFHSTGSNNPNIKRYVQPDDNAANKNELIKIIGKNAYGNDWNHIARKAGLNAWIGKLADGSVASVQTMPWNYRPWGCGSGSKGSCNDGWIQFEICEDALTNKTYFEKVYKEACELTAYLCKIFKIDPKGTTTLNGVTVPTILCHQDSYKLKLGSNHSDVYHWFNKHGKNMETVRADVYELLNPKPVVNNASKFKAGDIVKITGSTYYNGKSVPSWVRNKTWIVRSAVGDRIVVDKSADGKNAIMSAFNTKDLCVATATEAKPANTTKPTTAPSAPVIKKGVKVKVKNGAKTYTGGNLSSFVYKKTYTVLQEPKGDRVVIGINGAVTAAVNKKDLIIV